MPEGMGLDADDLELLIESVAWQVNSLIDDFPLSGDRILDALGRIKTQEALQKYLVEDFEKLNGYGKVLQKLFLARQVLTTPEA